MVSDLDLDAPRSETEKSVYGSPPASWLSHLGRRRPPFYQPRIVVCGGDREHAKMPNFVF
jgi:hypothetical protein